MPGLPNMFVQRRRGTPCQNFRTGPISANGHMSDPGTSAASKDKLDRMMEGFGEFEGIMKDATRVGCVARG
jgi:hypothetical protein